MFVWIPVTPAPEYEQFTDADGKKLVELRSTGQMTIIPPSVHPSGKRLRWVKAGVPTRVSHADLLDRVKKISAASLVARHWPAVGNRHFAVLALAGALPRGGRSMDETADFVAQVAKTAGDEEWQDRENNVRKTVQRLEQGDTATDYRRFNKFSERRSSQSWPHGWG